MIWPQFRTSRSVGNTSKSERQPRPNCRGVSRHTHQGFSVDIWKVYMRLCSELGFHCVRPKEGLSSRDGCGTFEQKSSYPCACRQSCDGQQRQYEASVSHMSVWGAVNAMLNSEPGFFRLARLCWRSPLHEPTVSGTHHLHQARGCCVTGRVAFSQVHFKVPKIF